MLKLEFISMVSAPGLALAAVIASVIDPGPWHEDAVTLKVAACDDMEVARRRAVRVDKLENSFMSQCLAL